MPSLARPPAKQPHDLQATSNTRAGNLARISIDVPDDAVGAPTIRFCLSASSRHGRSLRYFTGVLSFVVLSQALTPVGLKFTRCMPLPGFSPSREHNLYPDCAEMKQPRPPYRVYICRISLFLTTSCPSKWTEISDIQAFEYISVDVQSNDSRFTSYC